MTFKDELKAALPEGFNAKIRYIRSRPKACEPLFSPLPGQKPEKTRLTGHFVAVSIDSGDGKDVISFAAEIAVYHTRQLTTIFVSKVDSTAWNSRIKPSPVKTTITTLLQWLADKEVERQPHRKVIISLFARAQSQYLFPGSSETKAKHVLDDRQLIKWWARVLDPIIPENATGGPTYQAYMTVPGFAKNELRSFLPSATMPTDAAPRWLPGDPLLELAQSRGVPEHAPPRCLLPRFDDDPKARYMSDLDDEIGISQNTEVSISPSKRKSGRWSSVRSLEQFWEMMAFRQECSSGRAVGFLWLVIKPQGAESAINLTSSQATMSSSQGQVFSQDPIPPTSDTHATLDAADLQVRRSKKQKRKPLTGPIIPRQPRLKKSEPSLSTKPLQESQARLGDGETLLVSKESYDRAIHTLLQLDFANLDIAVQSTAKWMKEVSSLAGLEDDFAFVVEGTAQPVSPTTASAQPRQSAVNDLGGMIRKKRKAAPETMTTDAAMKEASVNVLGSGMIRKKPKPAVD